MPEGQEILQEVNVERQQTLAERQAIKERIHNIVEIGKPVLEGSNLVRPQAEITPDDLQTLRKFYEVVAPTPENWPQTGSNWTSEYGLIFVKAVVLRLAGSVGAAQKEVSLVLRQKVGVFDHQVAVGRRLVRSVIVLVEDFDFDFLRRFSGQNKSQSLLQLIGQLSPKLRSKP